MNFSRPRGNRKTREVEKRIFPPASVIPTSMRPSVRPYGETKDQRTKRQQDYWTMDHGTTRRQLDRGRGRGPAFVGIGRKRPAFVQPRRCKALRDGGGDG